MYLYILSVHSTKYLCYAWTHGSCSSPTRCPLFPAPICYPPSSALPPTHLIFYFFALAFFVFFYSYHFLPYFSEELNELNKKLKLPRTVIAVVGDTGAGKSSLLNALLDHGNILPTSGMRACTAVVVEVQQNLRTNCYEADIDFLSLEVSNSVEK